MKHGAEQRRKSSPGGVALAITLIVLVVLAVTVTILTLRVSQARHRQQYIMDYQKARYGLDSAMKYIFSVLPEKTFTYEDRKDAPDFSDLFWLNREQYLTYLSAWAENATDEQLQKYLKEPEPEEEQLNKKDLSSLLGDFMSKITGGGGTEETEPNTTGEPNEPVIYVDPNQIIVPGPYGPSWPNVIEPIELEIGDCEITIAIEDENAKMPMSWAVTNQIQTNKEAKAALETFGEWMSIDKEHLGMLMEQLDALGKVKQFQLNYSPVLLQTPVNPQPGAQPAPATPPPQPGRFSSRRVTPPPPPQPVQQKARPEVANAADFAKLFHSSLLNLEPLATPIAEMAFEDESPLKYLALWGSQRINLNTAPRHVLEAAFTFGGDPVEITDKIIRARKEKPFKTTQEVRDVLFTDIQALDRASPYIDVKSNIYSIKITSVCGKAKANACAAVIKEGKQMEKLIVLYGR